MHQHSDNIIWFNISNLPPLNLAMGSCRTEPGSWAKPLWSRDHRSLLCHNNLSPCHTFPGKPCRQVTRDIFAARSSAQKARSCQYFTRILPASVYASSICQQTSFEHAQNFARVSYGYLHGDVIAKNTRLYTCKTIYENTEAVVRDYGYFCLISGT